MGHSHIMWDHTFIIVQRLHVVHTSLFVLPLYHARPCPYLTVPPLYLQHMFNCVGTYAVDHTYLERQHLGVRNVFMVLNCTVECVLLVYQLEHLVIFSHHSRNVRRGDSTGKIVWNNHILITGCGWEAYVCG